MWKDEFTFKKFSLENGKFFRAAAALSWNPKPCKNFFHKTFSIIVTISPKMHSNGIITEEKFACLSEINF